MNQLETATRQINSDCQKNAEQRSGAAFCSRLFAALRARPSNTSIAYLHCRLYGVEWHCLLLIKDVESTKYFPIAKSYFSDPWDADVGK